MEDDLIYFDSTGDGLNDSAIQYNPDGSFNVYHDFDGDGRFEIMQQCSGEDNMGDPTQIITTIDTDNDGNYDTVYAEQYDQNGRLQVMQEVHDYDQDGQADMQKTFADTTGDGQFDTVQTIHVDNSGGSILQSEDLAMDMNADQIADFKMHTDIIDTTGNGQPDLVQVTMTDEYGQTYAYEMSYEEYISDGADLTYSTTCVAANSVDYGQYDPATSNPEMVSGDPEHDMQYWEYQGDTQRCAIYAQKFAIEEALGREIDVEELVAIADENGWFDADLDSGTVTLNMNKLLEYYGVEHEMSFGNDIDAIEQALNEGHNVIVSVDSGQIWYGEDNNIFSPFTAADHAVEVIGIDRTDPEHPMVILNDSGTPNGCGELVPLEVFVAAWGAGDSQMIVCYA